MKRKVLCPYCGKMNPSTEERCLDCGRRLPEEAYKALQQPTPAAGHTRKRLTRVGESVLGGVIILVTLVMILSPWDSLNAKKEKAQKEGRVTKETASMAQQAADDAQPEASDVRSMASAARSEASAARSEASAVRSEASAVRPEAIPTRPEASARGAITTRPETITIPPEAARPAASPKYSLSPPYKSYLAKDYALPEEQEYASRGSGENGVFSMEVDKVRRAPYLKYAGFDILSFDPQERDKIWHQALNTDLFICELTLRNLSGEDVELYTPDFKATVQNGAMMVSRPGMENTGTRGMPLEKWTLHAGETRTFVGTFPVESSVPVMSVDYMRLAGDDGALSNISISLPIDPIA